MTGFVLPTIIEIPTVAAFQESGPRAWMWAPIVVAQTFTGISVVMASALVVRLPDGSIRHRRERRFLRWAWIVAVFPSFALVSNASIEPQVVSFPGVPPIRSPFVIEAMVPYGRSMVTLTALSYLILFGAVALQVMRYRKASTRERKQVRWVLYAGVVGASLALTTFLLTELNLISGVQQGNLLFALVSAVPILLFPASVVVAIMEPPWVDVDIVIHRSFVYGALSFVILLLYVGVAAAFGVAAGSRLSIELAVVLTVVVAVLFQPARQRLQVVADRWVFGIRPTKFEAVTELGETISDAADPTELLPQLVETIRRALGLEWATAVLDDGSRAEAGEVAGDPVLTAPIEAADEEIGVIGCGRKTEGSLGDDEIQLVHTLARQVGLAVMNARLAGRIVTAAEAERRRIERNIHDGAQQELVALIARLGMARASAAAGTLSPAEIDELQYEARRILTELRELAQGIHPSVLSDGGLLEAVEERCARLPLEVTLEASAGLRSERFDDDIEGAAYFFVTETLTNVLKHADATSASVSMKRRGETLLIEVSDDGRGFDPAAVRRNGLAGLGDRIRALGGVMSITSRPGQGTAIIASLPIS